ncbi:hypothetical protein CFOL_v3_11633, partial [Cephalotus follicularis]
NTDGRRGGLALLWDEDVDLNIKFFSQSHIDAEIHIIGREVKWRLTGIYENSEAHHCHETWSLLGTLALQSDVSWLYMGDFNEILNIYEEEGGNERNIRQMELFHDILD